MLKNKLDIILITYNRKDFLQETLNQILEENSPIKDFEITILDNASTDGTSEMLVEYCKQYPNLKHIRHNVNIGGNANICRAYEIVSKEYAWVLCDDDQYNWEHWNKIEEAILSDKYDVIYTCKNITYDTPQTLYPMLFVGTLVPACIYKMEHRTPTMMQNMYGSINTWFPQGVFLLDILVNKKGQYFIPQENLLSSRRVDDAKGEVLLRGNKIDDIHPELERMYWHVGFMKAADIIKDKKLRKKICEEVHFTEEFDLSNYYYMKYVLNFNEKFKENNIKNIIDVLLRVSPKYSVPLILSKIMPIWIDVDDYHINICILYKIKLSIRIKPKPAKDL